MALLICGLAVAQAPVTNGEHDFDSHVGTWTTHLTRLQQPLTGSTTWVEYDGTTAVRKVWNGSADLVSSTWRVPPVTSKR